MTRISLACLVVLGIASCTADIPREGPVRESSAEDEQPPVELVFPVHDWRDQMQALLIGELVRQRRCLLVVPPEENEAKRSTLPVWPPGFSYTWQDGRVHVLDEEGAVVAESGTPIEVGGGFVRRKHLGAALRAEVAPCRGEYFIVGDFPSG